MYSLAVSDHVMIAHSFEGAIFDEAGLVCDIGLALATLKAVLGDLNYRNLDEMPDFKGRNTTTEYLAGEIFRRLKRRVAVGAFGPGTVGALSALRVTLRESPVAWAAFEGPLD